MITNLNDNIFELWKIVIINNLEFLINEIKLNTISKLEGLSQYVTLFEKGTKVNKKTKELKTKKQSFLHKIKSKNGNTINGSKGIYTNITEPRLNSHIK